MQTVQQHIHRQRQPVQQHIHRQKCRLCPRAYKRLLTGTAAACTTPQQGVCISLWRVGLLALKTAGMAATHCSRRPPQWPSAHSLRITFQSQLLTMAQKLSRLAPSPPVGGWQHTKSAAACTVVSDSQMHSDHNWPPLFTLPAHTAIAAA